MISDLAFHEHMRYIGLTWRAEDDGYRVEQSLEALVRVDRVEEVREDARNPIETVSIFRPWRARQEAHKRSPTPNENAAPAGG